MTRWAAGDPSLGDADRIDADSVLSGVALAEWFKYECRRVYQVLAEEGADRKKRQLVELIERNGGRISPRDLMRCSRQFKKTAEAEQALNELVKAELGAWEHDPPNPQGGRPSKRFALFAGADADKTSNAASQKGFCPERDADPQSLPSTPEDQSDGSWGEV